MFTIEVYSSEARCWYLWLDGVKPADLYKEQIRVSKLYDAYRVVMTA